MVILYSMVHLSCNCFIILPAAPFHYLAIEWPPGILVRTNFIFVIGEQGTQEVRRKGIRAVYIGEYIEKSWHTSPAHVRLSFRICLSMLSSAQSVLHWACTHLCSQHCSCSMFDLQYQLWSLLHQVTVTDWPMDWIVGQKQVSLDPRYPRTWPFHYSIWNALEHEVKRIVGG